MHEQHVGILPSWRSAVVASNLRPPVKLVLLIVDMFASEMGCLVWPGKMELARLAGMTQDQVTKCLKAASAEGFLQYRRGYSGSGGEYRFVLPSTLGQNVAVMRAGVSDPIPEEGTIEQALERNGLERAALEDVVVRAAVEKLGGRVVNIRVAPSTDGGYDSPEEELE